MSFRYTNNLVGALRHRLALEAAHRDIARRTFTGVCNGIEVTCTGYGTVIQIRMTNEKKYEPYYRSITPITTTNAKGNSGSAKETTDGKGDGEGKALDLQKLSTSIQAAVWDCMRHIAAAKEHAHHRSLADNTVRQSQAELKHWYEHDATTIAPHPFDALKQELATPWMQAVRFGKPDAAHYLHPRTVQLMQGNAEALNELPETEQPQRGVQVLTAEDCDVQHIPIGAAHPLFTPALVQLEAQSLEATSGQGKDKSNVDERAVLRAYKREMSRDEQRFWDRVELIRRGQLASLPAGGAKRGYADQSATVVDTAEEKIELHFTH